MTFCIDCQKLYDNASDPKPKRKLALYNLKTEKTAILCGLHKKKDMINVISIRCGCGKIASFPGNYCKKCFVKNNPGVKPIDNMKKCQYKDGQKDCQKHPNYNKPGEKRGIYCLPHAILVWGINNFENVVKKQCECGKRIKSCEIHGDGKRGGLYKSYEKVVALLASVSLHFPDHYTKELFDAAVKKSTDRPSEARHPIPSIDGMRRILDVISEFRERSPEEVHEHEKRFAAVP